MPFFLHIAHGEIERALVHVGHRHIQRREAGKRHNGHRAPAAAHIEHAAMQLRQALTENFAAGVDMLLENTPASVSKASVLPINTLVKCLSSCSLVGLLV